MNNKQYQAAVEVEISILNGQFSQAKKQIKNYGIKKFLKDYKDYLIYNDPDINMHFKKISKVIELI